MSQNRWWNDVLLLLCVSPVRAAQMYFTERTEAQKEGELRKDSHGSACTAHPAGALAVTGAEEQC